MFKIGEYVIYKRTLCKLKDITEKNNNYYYKLYPIEDENLIINVPINNNSNNLRYPISKEEADILIKKIPTIEEIKANDKVLEQVYQSLMKTNTHEDLIKIIKTTYLRNEKRRINGKKIADKDLTYFKKAEDYLYNELSISLNMNYEECKNYIISKLSTAELNNKKEEKNNL